MTGTNLTEREHQIFDLIGRGSSTKDIAGALGISIWTVASHRKRLCEKLGVHTTAELVALSSAESKANSLLVGRRADRCRLALDLRMRHGRVRLTYSGPQRRTPGAITVQIGRNLYYF